MTEPKREALDFEEVEPAPDAPTGNGTVGSIDAPYGYKKDGTPAKKRGRPVGWRKDGSSGTTPRRTSGRGSLETQIAGFLFTVNVPLQLIPALSKDALDPTEINALAKAIDEECQRNARFRKAVERALAVQGGTNLILIAGLILGRRFVRHGIVPIPEEVGGANGADQMMGFVIAAAGGGAKVNPNMFVMPQEAATSSSV